jgi:hypothetical protein
MSTTQPTAPQEAAPRALPYAQEPAFSSSRILGTLSLVGGIASIVFGQTVILPIAAIVLGFLAHQREPQSRAFAIWGIVLGFLALFGWILIVAIGAVVAVPFFLVGAF